ncbi:hypothetical protein P154DRAFT_522910, partial [Amniculicola lignicola CBS 123094]
EVDLNLLLDRLWMDTNPPPTQQQRCSYAVYLLIDIRYEMARRDLLPRAIRRELLLAYAEHGHYPGGKANRTQAEKLGDITNRRGIVGPLRARREKE